MKKVSYVSPITGEMLPGNDGNTTMTLPEEEPMTKCEDITHPSHYEGKIEPIEYVMSNGLGFCEGNVVKYVTRHRLKGGADDIRKAIRYCEYILRYRYDIRDC